MESYIKKKSITNQLINAYAFNHFHLFSLLPKSKCFNSFLTEEYLQASELTVCLGQRNFIVTDICVVCCLNQSNIYN